MGIASSFELSAHLTKVWLNSKLHLLMQKEKRAEFERTPGIQPSIMSANATKAEAANTDLFKPHFQCETYMNNYFTVFNNTSHFPPLVKPTKRKITAAAVHSS